MAAGAGRAEGDRAGPLCRQGGQLLRCAYRRLRLDHEHGGVAHHQRHRGKILGRVVGQPGNEMRGYGDCAGGRQEEEVPVRLPAGDIFRADRAVGAGPVLHDNALPQERLELVGEEAPDEVGRPASGKRDHDAHGPGGEVLGSDRGREHWGGEPSREKGGGRSSEPPLAFGLGQSSGFQIGAAGPTLRESSTTERR